MISGPPNGGGNGPRRSTLVFPRLRVSLHKPATNELPLPELKTEQRVDATLMIAPPTEMLADESLNERRIQEPRDECILAQQALLEQRSKVMAKPLVQWRINRLFPASQYLSRQNVPERASKNKLACGSLELVLHRDPSTQLDELAVQER